MVKAKKAPKVFVSSSGRKTPKRIYTKDPYVVPTKSCIEKMIETYKVLYSKNKKTLFCMTPIFCKKLAKKTSSRMHLLVLMNMIRNEIATF